MQLITNLPHIIFWTAVAIFLIACTLLSYSLMRSQRHSAGDAEPEQSFHRNGVLEMIWTLIPVGILAVLLLLTYQTMQIIE